MMTKTTHGVMVAVLCLWQMAAESSALAQTVRTQTFSLHKGWNAVCLQVNPASPKPADCFQGAAVSMVAAFTGADKSLQFGKNAGVINLVPQNGWDVWYAGSRQDAFLTSFFQMNGGKAYLVRADSDCTWNVTGTVVPAAVNWRPNTFSLVGFCLDSVSPPTFDQFFAGSAAHHPYQIYRLVNDNWEKVDNAQSTQMRSGEAYWIYCKGKSSYQGPLTVKAPNAAGFSLNGSTASGIFLQNNSPNPLGVQVRKVAGGAQLPLAYQLRAVTATNVVTAALDLPDTFALPSFDAGEKRGLWLAVQPERMTSATQTNLLKITTDLGTEFWLPVTANRSETQLSN